MDRDGRHMNRGIDTAPVIAKKNLWDAVIVSDDGVRFKVNRKLMSSCSPYFRILFSTPLRGEDGSGDSNSSVHQLRKQASVPGVETDLLCAVVHYAHKGETLVDFSNVEKLLPIADQLLVDDMKADCCNFLLNIISPTNCFGMIRFGRDYNAPNLEQGAFYYTLKNFELVLTSSDEFVELKVRDLLEILDSDYLVVDSEDVVWNAIVRWIEHCPVLRNRFLPSLFKSIRFGFYPKERFLGNFLAHPLVVGNESIRPLLPNATASAHKLFNRSISKQRKCEHMLRTRCPHEVIFCVGGWGTEPTDLTEIYDYEMDVWVRIKDAADARAYHQVLELEDDIYVIGGTNGSHSLNTCYRFNVRNYSWVYLSPMHFRRCYLCAVVLRGKIYAIGGLDGSVRLDLVELYQPQLNRWEIAPPMKEIRSDASACVISNRILVVGGFNGVRYLESAEIYDPDEKYWKFVRSMTGPRSGLTCVSYESLCFVMGGFDGIQRLPTCEVYDVVTNRWGIVSPMLNGRSNFAAVVLNGYIYVFGGFNGVETIDYTEKLDLETRVWELVAPLKMKRSALAATVHKSVYLFKDYIPHNRFFPHDGHRKCDKKRHNHLHNSKKAVTP